MDTDEALDRLYGAPLDRFTEERNAIAGDLKKDGDREAAERIGKLKKPSVAAWAVNQLARRENGAIKDLLELQEGLAAAGNASELRDLTRRRREVLGRLLERARDVLSDAGHSPGAATIEKVSQTLMSATDRENRELLAKGRLTRELVGTGLDAFGIAGADEDVDDHDRKPAVSMKVKRQVEKLRRDAERAEAEATSLAQEANFAEERARRARVAAEEAEETARVARERVQTAAEEAGL
ncbi:MAG TPA: alanine-zipper protein [Actinomycetota bacterium]|nr:alanine-zipper protein [Actinomycetota bacterium]